MRAKRTEVRFVLSAPRDRPAPPTAPSWGWTPGARERSLWDCRETQPFNGENGRAGKETSRSPSEPFPDWLKGGVGEGTECATASETVRGGARRPILRPDWPIACLWGGARARLRRSRAWVAGGAGGGGESALGAGGGAEGAGGERCLGVRGSRTLREPRGAGGAAPRAPPPPPPGTQGWGTDEPRCRGRRRSRDPRSSRTRKGARQRRPTRLRTSPGPAWRRRRRRLQGPRAAAFWGEVGTAAGPLRPPPPPPLPLCPAGGRPSIPAGGGAAPATGLPTPRGSSSRPRSPRLLLRARRVRDSSE